MSGVVGLVLGIGIGFSVVFLDGQGVGSMIGIYIGESVGEVL